MNTRAIVSTDLSYFVYSCIPAYFNYKATFDKQFASELKCYYTLKVGSTYNLWDRCRGQERTDFVLTYLAGGEL